MVRLRSRTVIAIEIDSCFGEAGETIPVHSQA